MSVIGKYSFSFLNLFLHAKMVFGDLSTNSQPFCFIWLSFQTIENNEGGTEKSLEDLYLNQKPGKGF